MWKDESSATSTPTPSPIRQIPHLCSSAQPEERLDPSRFLPNRIRNVCLLAHVDHGKTTVADSILTLSGIVQDRSAGQLRFMDNRVDERERKITMKSSCMCIPHFVTTPQERIPQLINLVDTPGHIDFTNEVNCATSLCDSALFIVDVVEGLTPQAKSLLKQAYSDKLKVLLIINKIDRLLLELRYNGDQVFHRIWNLVAECNNFMRTLVTTNSTDVTSSSGLTFNPQMGEVIFASGIDGWGFTLRDIAELFINKIKGESLDTLTNKLWDEDLFVNKSTNTIKTGAIAKQFHNVFTQLVCSTLIHIYEKLVLQENSDEIDIILKKLRIDKSTLLLKTPNFRNKTKIIMMKWKSLGVVIARQCYEILPSPIDGEVRTHTRNVASYPCNRGFGFIKMFYNIVSNTRELPGVMLCSMRKLFIENERETQLLFSKNYNELCQKVSKTSEKKFAEILLSDDNFQVISLVRICSGTLHSGQRLAALDAFLEPVHFMSLSKTVAGAVSFVTIGNIFLPIGNQLRKVKSVGPGYICGVTLMGPFPSPRITIADFQSVPIFEERRIEPIMYNVITPVAPADSSVLRMALYMLQYLDTSVNTFTNEMGEFVFCTLGKVHLDKCLNDLRQNFVDVPMKISEPIYSLRETVTDSQPVPISMTIPISESLSMQLELFVTPLPLDIINILKKYHSVIYAIKWHHLPPSAYLHACIKEKKKLSFTNVKYLPVDDATLKRLEEELESVMKEDDGIFKNLLPRNILWISESESSVNVIFNITQSYKASIFERHNEQDMRTRVFNNIVRAFQGACDAGPICKEKISNCAFVLNKFNLIGEADVMSDHEITSQHSAILAIKSLFHEAFMKSEISIMEPMLRATIHSHHIGEFFIYYLYYDLSFPIYFFNVFVSNGDDKLCITPSGMWLWCMVYLIQLQFGNKNEATFYQHFINKIRFGLLTISIYSIGVADY
ncbi:hypothetical protein RI129_011733 [Pyrocoelia pectoralis]|uniref:Tr-type G domain-containing protein n=1 Tax=Pyrocoelia pectoralis TaxID=417401 RepID=A0AAN7V688_9COLE